MAKAVPRPLPAASGGNYFKEVWEELKKVLWPTRTELSRMTGIVVATVLLFAAIIGSADYALGLVVRQLYASPGTAPRTTPAPAPAVPSRPTAAAHPPAVPAPSASAPSAPAPSAAPTTLPTPVTQP